MPPALPALVDFILRHAQVQSYVCTFIDGETNYACDPRRCDDYNLLYCMRGRVTWHVEGEPIAMRAGDLLIVPPNANNFGKGQTRLTLGSFHITVTLPGGQDAMALLDPPMMRRVEADTALDWYMRSAMAEFTERDRGDAMLTMPSWSRLVAMELIRNDAAVNRLSGKPIEPLVLDLLDELQQRVDEPVNLDDLAELSGYSPQHLNRVFNRVLGVTPLQHLARLRLERAGDLLLQTQLTIRAVAERVGYDDPYYFSRQFKAHFGRSPAQYRRMPD